MPECLRYSDLRISAELAGGLQRAFYPPGFRFHWHSHDFYELALVLQGSGVHEHDGGRDSIHAGDVILIAPACRHRLAAGRQALVFFNLACQPASMRRHREALAGLPGWHTDNGCAIWRPDADDRRWLTERLEDLEATGGPDDLAQSALLLECAWRHRRAQRRQPALPALLRRALALMDEPEYFACGPADLADTVGCSREHLARLARRHLDRSLADMQSVRRLDHAARLLRHSEEQVTAIAAASGHGNLGHFYRCFRQRFGCAPGVYRKQHRVQPV